MSLATMVGATMISQIDPDAADPYEPRPRRLRPNAKCWMAGCNMRHPRPVRIRDERGRLRLHQMV